MSIPESIDLGMVERGSLPGLAQNCHFKACIKFDAPFQHADRASADYLSEIMAPGIQSAT